MARSKKTPSAKTATVVTPPVRKRVLVMDGRGKRRMRYADEI